MGDEHSDDFGGGGLGDGWVLQEELVDFLEGHDTG